MMRATSEACWVFVWVDVGDKLINLSYQRDVALDQGIAGENMGSLRKDVAAGFLVQVKNPYQVEPFLVPFRGNRVLVVRTQRH